MHIERRDRETSLQESQSQSQRVSPLHYLYCTLRPVGTEAEFEFKQNRNLSQSHLVYSSFTHILQASIYVNGELSLTF